MEKAKLKTSENLECHHSQNRRRKAEGAYHQSEEENVAVEKKPQVITKSIDHLSMKGDKAFLGTGKKRKKKLGQGGKGSSLPVYGELEKSQNPAADIQREKHTKRSGKRKGTGVQGPVASTTKNRAL